MQGGYDYDVNPKEEIMDLIYLMNFSMTHFPAVPPKKGNDSKKLPIMRTDIMEKDGNYLMELNFPDLRKKISRLN